MVYFDNNVSIDAHNFIIAIIRCEVSTCQEKRKQDSYHIDTTLTIVNVYFVLVLIV